MYPPIFISIMAEILYPKRMKCKTCRKGLNKTVLDGLYCSYKCANLPQPSDDIAQAPRHCRRAINGVWGWKTRFRYENEVQEKLRLDPATNIYRCDYCHFLHVGHSRPDEAPTQLKRTVTDIQTLGSVILRYREQKNISKKDLAKMLKVPLIRITEIENGDPKLNPTILFAVLYKLRLTVEITGK